MQSLHRPRSPVAAAFAYLGQRNPQQDDLPQRVTDAIDRREAAAERSIGWVQLVAVLFFGALYAIAPRADGAVGAAFTPLALSMYLGFTLFRLVLSYRVTLPGWFLVLSILVDVALLCALIFSFHIQYDQPAAFYLKAPTMMYLFIFISLRALRFDPRYVLLAGLAASLSWVGMVVYALMSDMGQMSITRNYVEYLTSNAILIGAEIDKSVTLLGFTVILSFALYRARDVFFDAMRARAEAEDLKRFFSPEVATTITHSESLPGTGRSEVREASILFVDVRGFTTTAADMPPEAVMAVLARYQDVAVQAIAARGGQIDKFLGDGILATFGAVRDSPTHAADAISAAVEAIAATDAAQADFRRLGWPGALVTGAGVAAGQVTVGVVGTQTRLEFTVIGNAVNRAAKLESANKAQGTRVLTDRFTFSTAMEQGHAAAAQDRRKVDIAGLGDEVEIVVLA